MNVKKILALMLCAMMLLSLAACGAKGNDKQADMSGDSSAMTGEPKTAEEALALHKELLRPTAGCSWNVGRQSSWSRRQAGCSTRKHRMSGCPLLPSPS